MTNFPKTKKCIKHHKIMTYREINSKLISQDIHCTKFKIGWRQPAEESNISVNEPTFGKKMCWDEGHSKSFSSSMKQRTKYAKNCADDILI